MKLFFRQARSEIVSLTQAAMRSAGEVRRWPRIRLHVAVVVTVAVVFVMLASSDVWQPSMSLSPGFGAPWWIYPVIGAGAGLTGMIVAGYLRTPVGAEATICDLRWPLFALSGIAMATGTRTAGGTFSGLLVGPPGSVSDVARLVIGMAAVALLAWALNGRLAREREVIALIEDGQEAESCATCRPLFPQRIPRWGTTNVDSRARK